MGHGAVAHGRKPDGAQALEEAVGVDVDRDPDAGRRLGARPPGGHEGLQVHTAVGPHQEALAPAAAVRSVLDALADWFTTRRRGPANRPPPAALLAVLDTALRVVWHEAPEAENVLLQLVGLRRGLFPDAEPPGPA